MTDVSKRRRARAQPVKHRSIAGSLRQIAEDERLQPAYVAQRQPQLQPRLAKRCSVGALRHPAGREEMIEQPLAISEAPAELFKLGRRQGQQRKRNFHDVVERQREANGAAAALAPPL